MLSVDGSGGAFSPRESRPLLVDVAPGAEALPVCFFVSRWLQCPDVVDYGVSVLLYLPRRSCIFCTAGLALLGRRVLFEHQLPHGLPVQATEGTLRAVTMSLLFFYSAASSSLIYFSSRLCSCC